MECHFAEGAPAMQQFETPSITRADTTLRAISRVLLVALLAGIALLALQAARLA